MIKESRKIPRVGFDLDGVILYNPLRVLRPLAVGIKKVFVKNKARKFFVPTNPLDRAIWGFLHKTSFRKNKGLREIGDLVKNKRIEAYLITGRYSFLERDLNKWLGKLKTDIEFTDIFYNKNDEQPNVFKQKMIEKLELNAFVEDNWDIVQHLSSRLESKALQCKIFWLSNFFDKDIEYRYKFMSLKDIARHINDQ
ncbi:hypothetical protein A2866_00035 [Candidatus Roizmanbacteria bacterium RIFCSPHIGHO2_01_FULL_39_8]|uniref:FCP1 homology domain-containing protein n=2 Tax=Candidatus Roizmaniibacteriota TaxID=1752723 RepID=A0A1F7GPD4_9BACT|nr:MAG: hypothetical protein A2866_00035 [Candidatus Roizmanbacteria bacterium RIFCSPHIGHO2_01_FULL_39_8]OGK25367.1 MAG: hypothetical protein A3C28_01280 [Candidatus Roizmanbacteria bacterium RIFCSPHIGHO2_02_FULL_39_9]